MDWVVESQRLGLRPMTEDDFDSLCVFLQDAEVMAAWEHAFSDDEVRCVDSGKPPPVRGGGAQLLCRRGEGDRRDCGGHGAAYRDDR